MRREYDVPFTPESDPKVEAYGCNRIPIAGYHASQTATAVDALVWELYAAAGSGQ